MTQKELCKIIEKYMKSNDLDNLKLECFFNKGDQLIMLNYWI